MEATLREDRKRLVRAAKDADTDVMDARERAYQTGNWIPVRAAEAECSAAYATWKAFDEAHPEIIAAIREEKKQRANANIWN